MYGVGWGLVEKGLGRSILGKNMQDLPGRKCSVCYERDLLVLGRNGNIRGSLELGIDQGWSDYAKALSVGLGLDLGIWRGCRRGGPDS